MAFDEVNPKERDHCLTDKTTVVENGSVLAENEPTTFTPCLSFEILHSRMKCCANEAWNMVAIPLVFVHAYFYCNTNSS